MLVMEQGRNVTRRMLQPRSGKWGVRAVGYGSGVASEGTAPRGRSNMIMNADADVTSER